MRKEEIINMIKSKCLDSIEENKLVEYVEINIE